jgi:O-methyltransferase involved in polyketide biosynthesis
MQYEKLFLLQLFAFAWHWTNSASALIEDKESYKLLGEKEYKRLEDNVCQLAKYFFPQLDEKYAVKQFMNRYVCPLPMATRLFCENALKTARYTGTEQLVMINQGYSTLPLRIKNVKTLDINRSSVTLKKYGLTPKLPDAVNLLLADDTSEVLSLLNEKYKFDNSKPAFVMLGSMPLFMDENSLESFLSGLADKLHSGSSMVFAYGDENYYTENCGKTPRFIRHLTGVESGTGYIYQEMEKLLSTRGFLIYEYQTKEDIQQQYIDNFNLLNTSCLTAPDNINYILAVKKEHRK